MDTDILVNDQIDDGWKLVAQLAAKGFDVTAAGWLKTSEEGRWFLYAVIKAVDDKGSATAYREAYTALQELESPWISWSDVKLISPTKPLARDILEIERRYVGRIPTRIRRPQLGYIGLEEAYIYPPVTAGDERWRGISIQVFLERPPDAYFVEFWPNELQAARGLGGQPRRVPRPVGVRIEGGQVTWYRAPENPLPYLQQDDYEQKALEAVKELAANDG